MWLCEQSVRFCIADLTQGHTCGPAGVMPVPLSPATFQIVTSVPSHRDPGCPSVFPCQTVIPTNCRLVTFTVTFTVLRLSRSLATAELPWSSRPSP